MRAASDTVKPVLLELGGKNALIAYPDADPDEVAAAVDRRHELHLVRAVVRLDQPRVRARGDPRRRARARQGAASAPSSPGIPTDPATTMGAIVSRGAVRARARATSRRPRRRARGCSAGGGRPTIRRSPSGFFVEPTVFADVTTVDAHRARGNLRPGAGDPEVVGRSRACSTTSTPSNTASPARSGPTTSRHRAPHGGGGRGRLRLDQRGRQAFPRRAVRRRSSSRASAARNASRRCSRFTQEKNIHVKLRPAKA